MAVVTSTIYIVNCGDIIKFACYSFSSSLSTTTDDATTSVSCPSSGYSTLVSCGFQSLNRNTAGNDGGWMSDDGKTCALMGRMVRALMLGAGIRNSNTFIASDYIIYTYMYT